MAQNQQRKHPVLTLARTPVEIAIEILGALGLAAMAYIIGTNWAMLPEKVPYHFNLQGTPDAWGGKSVLLTVPLVTVAVYAGLSVLWKFPHLFNYPWPITEENAPVQYRLSRMLMAVIKGLLVWLAVYIAWTEVQLAFRRSDIIGIWFLPAAIATLMLTIVVYLVVASRQK